MATRWCSRRHMGRRFLVLLLVGVVVLFIMLPATHKTPEHLIVDLDVMEHVVKAETITTRPTVTSHPVYGLAREQRMLPPAHDSRQLSEEQVEQLLVERRQRLTLACSRMNLTNKETPLWSNLYVHEPSKFVFCPVPKIASTNWKIVFSELYGFVKPDDPMLNNNNRFWLLWTNRVFKSVKKMEQYSDVERQHILQNYTFGMVARHPIERVVSAHRDKFAISYYETSYGKQIMRKYRKMASPLDLASGKGVKFEEFVRYLLDTWDAAETFEYHWQRQYELCTPCSLPFKYIAHFETANRDCTHMLNKIGVDSTQARFRTMGANNNKGAPSSSLVAERLATLSAEQKERLYHIYSNDLDLLGY